MNEFRPARVEDEALLYHWRAEGERKGRDEGWYHGPLTSALQHRNWFIHRINQIPIWIWEDSGRPVGMFRVDTNGEISFHVETGDAAEMLRRATVYADSNGGRLKAVIDAGDHDKAKALMDAGYLEHPVRFFSYRR